MSERPHRKLIVWQKAMDFVETIYKVTERFPADERFGLVAQMRRAAVSIASNIAEGAARQTRKETMQFFFVSRGSVSELDTQVEIVSRLQWIDAEQQCVLADALNELGRLLNGLIASKSSRSTALPHSLFTHSLTH